MDSALGQTLDALATTIANRRDAGDESYTHRLLTGNVDDLLKKVMEEAGEVALAAKDVAAENSAAIDSVAKNSTAKENRLDHLRYEAADVVYHLLVVLERYGITLDDLAAELNTRMTVDERPSGASTISPEHVNRGK